MIDIDQVIKEVSNQLEVDREIVERTCKHIFTCVVDTMKSDTDDRDILFNNLLKFKLKRRFKENKLQKYTSK